MMASNFPEYWQSARIFVHGYASHLLIFCAHVYTYTSTNFFLTQEQYRSSTKTSASCSQHARPRTRTEDAAS